MAFVVHDLKNPVNAMDLQAQLLLREQNLSPTGRESARQIRNEARQLTRMIVNLLDVAKADEGQLVAHRKRVALGPLVAAVVSELQPAAEMCSVSLRSALETEDVFADEDLLRRTLTNLVENAVRYAPPETEVVISAARATHDGASATELRVNDAGGGVPESMRERIFEPFVQVESGGALGARTSRGLGLAFCKLAALAHGGAISVEDAAPGTLFRMRLPDDE
jgi:signal transduction histidine kinase